MPKSTQVPAVNDWIIVSGKDNDIQHVYGHRLIISRIDQGYTTLPVFAAKGIGDLEGIWLRLDEFYIV